MHGMNEWVWTGQDRTGQDTLQQCLVSCHVMLCYVQRLRQTDNSFLLLLLLLSPSQPNHHRPCLSVLMVGVRAGVRGNMDMDMDGR